MTSYLVWLYAIILHSFCQYNFDLLYNTVYQHLERWKNIKKYTLRLTDSTKCKHSNNCRLEGKNV